MAGGDRPAVSHPGGGRQAVAAVWRIESARIVATLARFTGDFALAEDLAQESLAEALVAWPRDGVPHNPAGWLLTVGRRRAIDSFRRRSALDEQVRRPGPASGRGRCDIRYPGRPPPGAAPDTGLPWDPDRIDDDLLALMFIACHPVLSREAQIALTLRVLGGLTSDEIARAFLVPTATVQARITRAKKTLAAARVPFEVPPPDECRKRLGSVLSVLYLIFTEGSTASSGSEWLRPDLAREAIRLTRILAAAGPGRAGGARPARAARIDRRPVPGAPGRRWRTGPAGRAGPSALGPGGDPPRAGGPGSGRAWPGLGAYGVQAAIAECHAVAPSVEETDWKRIVLLYEALGRVAPSPVVELNRAVAISVAQGPAAALPVVDELVAAGRLAGSICCPACAASCSAGSGSSRMHDMRSSSPSGSAETSASATCSGASSLPWPDPGCR